ncbi:MAG: tetratricopeptide repeat protein [Rhodocyclales bacterium]|nr:tetratricopeptide repeat protein [Rhodocyclales bacterium]
MTSDDTNTADGEKVDKAVEAIAAGNLAAAKSLLLTVIKNSPEQYSHQTATQEGDLIIRFWDQQEFLHYVTWREPTQKIFWNVSVYPRAFFYLGFIGVAERDYPTAIGYLDKAAALEPTNPKITLEKAQALMGLKRTVEALKLFEQVSTIGPFVSGSDVARGLRGRGFILIELGRVAEAEEALNASLKLDPNSDVAKNELKYLANLKGGGSHAPMKLKVTTSGKNLALCVICGEKFEHGSIVDSIGSSGVICDRCKNKSTKKPWQFWK